MVLFVSFVFEVWGLKVINVRFDNVFCLCVFPIFQSNLKLLKYWFTVYKSIRSNWKEASWRRIHTKCMSPNGLYLRPSSLYVCLEELMRSQLVNSCVKLHWIWTLCQENLKPVCFFVSWGLLNVFWVKFYRILINTNFKATI